MNKRTAHVTDSLASQRHDPLLTILIRAALFAALNYVLSLSLVWLMNVKPLFALVFVSAGVWGWPTALATGILAMGIWTFANPFGPAPLPVAAAQIFGAILAALLCSMGAPLIRKTHGMVALGLASLFGLLVTAIFFVTVNSVDALINQPFWPWFVSGMIFSILPIALNAILFPLLVPVIQRLTRLRLSL